MSTHSIFIYSGMTQEEKQLILKDLCTRLPYRVTVHATIDGDNTLLGVYNDRVFTTCEEPDKYNDYPVECIKPYLRPMSTMTEEEKKKIQALYHENTQNVFKDPDKVRGYRFYDISVVDWLNSHHFDYRGLIPMGLALEAPKDMYKTE